MLVDDVFDKRPKLNLPPYFPGEEILKPLRQRLSKAEIFAFDRNAVAMAANVALSKPSSILAAFPWIHLPHEFTWIEMANVDLRDAMADLGSPNLQRENTMTTIERSGFLIRMVEKGDQREMIADYVHRDRTPEGRVLTDLSPVRLRIKMTGRGLEDFTEEFPEILKKARELPEGVKISGRVREHHRLLKVDEEELQAETEINDRITAEPHPDMSAMKEAGLRLMGAAKVALLEQRQADEAIYLFKLFALPALILLNCRNAIETEEVKPTLQQNRHRRLRGKKPLIAYQNVRIKLTAAQRRRTSRDFAGDTQSFIRGTLVSGHFKVRKTGIFWWSPHARRGYGAVIKRRIVTE